MDSILYRAAISGNVDVIFSYIHDKPTDQVLELQTKMHNNILHLASLSGKTEAVETILSMHPLLVNEVNSYGNSAVHLAAKGGYTEVLGALIKCRKQLPTEDPLMHNTDSWKDLLRLQNKENYMAIHEATRYNHIESVRLLLEHDPGFSPPTNKKSMESLLYMAASRGFYDLIEIFINEGQELPCRGPFDRTALHGAVDCNSIECVRILLQWFKKFLHWTDDNGWTPLDSAAYLGYGNLVSELLLHADSSSATDLASNAILIAASAGHVSVVKELILHCPSCWDTVDDQGRNVLHVAIKHEKKEVIEFLLVECSTIVGILLAQKDDEGNTALHLLVIYNCCVPKLIQHPLVDKEALNNKGFTPLDLANYDSDNRILSTSNAKNEVVEELKRAGAVLHSKKSHALAPKEEREAKNASVRKMIDNHMIVAALIATVAFSAGFAMPGGYVSSGSPNAGTAVLGRHIAFQAFVISDVLALLFSSSALFTYFILALFSPSEETKKFETIENSTTAAMLLNMLGLGSIIIAFISGTYAVLHSSYALAIASSVVASFTFLLHFRILIL